MDTGTVIARPLLAAACSPRRLRRRQRRQRAACRAPADARLNPGQHLYGHLRCVGLPRRSNGTAGVAARSGFLRRQSDQRPQPAGLESDPRGPGDPDASFIIQKLDGTQTVGARMPDGGPYLTTAKINVIRQ